MAAYTAQQKWLHWISAAVTLWASITGLMATSALASGALMMTHGIHLLGVIPLPQLIYDKAQLRTTFEIHRALCLCLAARIALHIAAVIKHAFGGVSVLRHMT